MGNNGADRDGGEARDEKRGAQQAAAQAAEQAAEQAQDDGLTIETLANEADGWRTPALLHPALQAGGVALGAVWRRLDRRLGRRARLARGALTLAIVAATLFALLNGPTLSLAAWRQLTFALRSGALAPKLAMTSWQRVAPPPGLAPAALAALTYTPDPTMPTTLYACLASERGIIVWRTDTLGKVWSASAVTATPAQSCQVKVALDATQRLLLVARAPDPARAGCASMALYLSALFGYQWTPVAPPTAAGTGACQSDAWASARWVFFWWTNEAVPEPVSALMRSADLGQTWQPADGDLPSRGAYLAPALTSVGAGGALLAQLYYWPRRGRLNILRQIVRSLDSGATWATLSGGPPVAVISASLEPRVAATGAWSALYATTYTDGGLAPPWVPDQPPEALQALDPHADAWNDLPPLPVNGAAPRSQQLGVITTLGVAPANTLLTLGVDPHTGVTGAVNANDLWLWAWDPHAREWRLGLAAPAQARLVGFSWGAGPVGGAYEQVYGAYLWLAGATGASGGQPLALVRAFIPVPSGS